MQEPGRPQLVRFPTIEAAAEIVAAAHHGVPEKGLVGLHFAGPHSAKAQPCELFGGPQFRPERPEDGPGVTDQVIEHGEVGLLIRRVLEGHRRLRSIPVGKGPPVLAGPRVRSH